MYYYHMRQSIPKLQFAHVHMDIASVFDQFRIIDTEAFSSAILQVDSCKVRLLAFIAIVKEEPKVPTFQNMVAHRQLENPITTVELKFEIGKIEFNVIFLLIGSLPKHLNGVQVFRRNHTILNLRQETLIFPFSSS